MNLKTYVYGQRCKVTNSISLHFVKYSPHTQVVAVNYTGHDTTGLWDELVLIKSMKYVLRITYSRDYILSI